MSNSSENLYQLDGRVPLGKALPFGLQHVLAMFVSNITPIMILAAAVGLDSAVSAALIQNCMVIAGIGTLVQLFPVWRLSLIHISEPTRQDRPSRMPSSA